jgi:hypothetical protein
MRKVKDATNDMLDGLTTYEDKGKRSQTTPDIFRTFNLEPAEITLLKNWRKQGTGFDHTPQEVAFDIILTKA